MRYLLTRLLWLPVILLAVASLTFFVLRLVPGDPMDQVATLVLDQGQLDAVRAQWALDQPLWRQYLLFIGNLAQGDLGLSMASGIEINRLLFERLPPTIELTLFAMIISTIIGVGAGIISAVTTNRIGRLFSPNLCDFGSFDPLVLDCDHAHLCLRRPAALAAGGRSNWHWRRL